MKKGKLKEKRMKVDFRNQKYYIQIQTNAERTFVNKYYFSEELLKNR